MKEFVTSLLEIDLGFLEHHVVCLEMSGTLKQSSMCILHKSTCVALHMLMTFDQLNFLSCSDAEHLVRQMIIWGTVVRRSSWASDFDGPSVVLLSDDEGGTVSTRSFSSWATAQQEAVDETMEEARFWREERNTVDKNNTRAVAAAERK